jgi:hypothetical protein
MVNQGDSIPTDFWVEAHILSAKLYFRMYAQEREKSKKYFVKAVGTLLRIKNLLPPIDLKVPSLKLPISLQRFLVEGFEDLDYYQLDDGSSSDEEISTKPEGRGR